MRLQGGFRLAISRVNRGEGRNLAAHALLTRRLRARKLETSFEPQPQSDFSSDPDPGNMPCKCWSPVLHSTRSVLGQIKPKQKLHFWPARVQVRSFLFTASHHQATEGGLEIPDKTVSSGLRTLRLSVCKYPIVVSMDLCPIAS